MLGLWAMMVYKMLRRALLKAWIMNGFGREDLILKWSLIVRSL